MKKIISVIFSFIALCAAAACELVVVMLPLLLSMKYSFWWLFLYFASIPLMFVLALLREKMKEKIDESEDNDDD